MNPGRPPLLALTGVRFVAAIFVVFYHYAPLGLPSLLDNAVRNGHLAVGLFFVLSGFVLAYNYAGSTVVWRKFWLARFARIYPAYLLGFLLMAPAVAFRYPDNPLKLAVAGLAAGTLVQGWFPGLELVWNGPGWSLASEAFFYLLFPILLPVLESLSRPGLWFIGGLCCVAALAAGDVLAYLPLLRLPEFVLGIAVGLLFLRYRAQAPRIASTIALACFMVVPPDALPAGPRNAVASALFATFLSAIAARRGFLASPLMTRLGDASYATYILQSPVMAYFLLATQGVVSRTSLTWSQFALYGTTLLVVSFVCFNWLERPARRWIIKVGEPKKEM